MLILLDNGHGGLINGKYQTPGKRKDWGEKGIIYEGEFNRAIVNGLIERLSLADIPYVNIAPEYSDIPLQTRVKRANAYADEDCFFLSIHSNAGGGEGFEVYTYYNTSKSDAIASRFGREFQREFPDKPLRTDYSDGDLDKEAGFYVLRKTIMPAVLTENFFMDNYEEFRTLLMTREGRDKIIDFHFKAIKRIQEELF